MIDIFRNVDGVEKVVCSVADDNATLKKAIMGVDEIVIDVTVDSVLDVLVSDCIRFEGIVYELNRDFEFNQKSKVEYQYSFVFEHPLYRLLDKLYLNKLSKKATFTLTGRLADFVGLLIWNINKTSENPEGVDSDWSAGDIPTTDYKTLTFGLINCRDVLTKLASDFGVEFYLKNKEINFVNHIENKTGLVFSQGKGKGLYTVSQKNVDTGSAITRIYPIGGTQNVPPYYRKSLVFDATVDGLFVHDEKRKLEGAYFPASSKITPTATTVDQTQVYSVSNGKLALKNSAPADLPAGSYAIDFTELSIKMASRYRPGNDYIPVNVNIDVVIEVTYKGLTIVGARRTIVKSLKNVNIVAAGNGWTYLDAKETFDITTNDLSGGTTLCLDIYNLDGTPYMNRIDVSCEGKSSIWVERIRYNTSIQLLSGINKGNEYQCLYYPEVLGRKNVIQVPEGSFVSTGDSYTIGNILKSKVPTDYFSEPSADQTMEGISCVDADGHLILPEVYIENFSEYSKIVECGVEFADIYPSFVGTVSSASDKNNSIIKCSEIDFDIKEVAVGNEARINFLTGDLMGKSFSFQWNNEKKEITLVEQEDETALADASGKKPTIPSTLKQAKVTDEFNFTGLILPNAYVTNAIDRLRKAATAWLEFHCRKRIKFDLNIDYRYLRGKRMVLPGDLVTLKVQEHNIDKIIRVTSVDRRIKTGELTCVVSNYLDEKWEKKIEGQISSMQTTVNGGGSSYYDATQMWATLSELGTEQIHKSHLTDALVGYATESWVNDKGYVTTTRLNELIGGASSAFDTLKEIEDYINSHESVTAGLIASLGNKVDKVTGMGLSEHSFTTTLRDKLNSIADGANKYILPVAQAAVLGGVMIGSNINVNAQGVISVAAPYSHPTQKTITVGAARHFLTGLAVNEYGHVTSATSAALTKDDLLSVLKDEDGVIRLDAQLALTGSLINFANLGTVNIPSLYDGIPVDGKSIYWENGTLKSSSTGGGGLAKVIVKVGLAAYESVDGVVTLPAYPTMPDLTNYVTTNTPQTIQGQKTFVSDQIFATGAYFGTNKKGTLHADGSITAEIFRKTGGTQYQLLRADGGVSTFTWEGQSGQPMVVWGGNNPHDYKVWNPANFRVANANTVGDIAASNLMTTHTEQVVSGKKIYSTDQYYNNNIGIVTIDGQGLLFSDGTRTITGDATRPHRIRSNDSNLEHWRNGVGRYDILDGYNWRSIVDGRYLLLTGGLLTGPLTANQDIKAGHMGWKAQLSSSSNTNEVLFGLALPGNSNNAYIRLGMNKIEYFNGANNTIWHSGNGGSGSGLDADTLDGMHDGLLTANRITLSDSRVAIKGGFDLNLMGPNFRFIAQYGSSTYWNNAPVGLNYGSVFQMMDSISGIGGQLAWDINHNSVQSTNSLYFRACNNLGWQNDWKEIAFLTSNVASATKLQTARLIYGQSFDGSGGVDGRIVINNSIGSSANYDEGIRINNVFTNPLIHFGGTGSSGTGDGQWSLGIHGSDKSFQLTHNLWSNSVISATKNGNIGIGTTDPMYKLHINGDTYTNEWFKVKHSRGLYIQDASVYYTNSANYACISSSGNEIVFSGADDMYVNYRGDGTTGRLIPKKWYWRAGTSDSWAGMEIGNLGVNGDLGVSGSLRADSGFIRASSVYSGYDSGVTNAISCSNWFRSNGATGWINDTYGGGMYMVDSDTVCVYGDKVLYNQGLRVWGIGGHHVGLKLYNQYHIGLNLANAAYTWGIYAHNDGNMYIGRRSGNVNDSSGSYYLIIGAGTMTYNGSIVLNGGGLITYSSDMRLKEIQEYFKPSLSELAALPIFAHSWRNGTPGVQLSTSAQAVQKIMPWNVFEGSDGYLKMDGTRTALAVSIRLAQLVNEYITNNERWKSDKDRQIEALQREVRELKQQLNVA